jgi:hypothetical protein
MKTVTIDIEIDLDNFNDDELVDELTERGYTVTNGLTACDDFDKDDWQYLINLVDNTQKTWYTHRIRDKLMNCRW